MSKKDHDVQVEFLAFDKFENEDIAVLYSQKGKVFGFAIIGKQNGKTYGYIVFNDESGHTSNIRNKLINGEITPVLVYPEGDLTHVYLSPLKEPLACFKYLNEVPGGDHE